nr:MAG TPA: hypothetical protein [Caudoviricetes sp.]
MFYRAGKSVRTTPHAQSRHSRPQFRAVVPRLGSSEHGFNSLDITARQLREDKASDLLSTSEPNPRRARLATK